MNRHVILGMICNVDDNSIAFSSINSRPWKLPIYSHNRFRMAQSADIAHLYLFVKVACEKLKQVMTF